MTRVALLWHMHQPYYEELVTREHILPWVRLHALKDYYGMAAMLEEFPDVRVTFNLVPSLLVQLEAFAAERAHDRFLELGAKPAEALTREDIRFILQNFFHAHRARMIDAYPRYGELLTRRGPAVTPAAIDAAARQFSIADLRDLQVWQKLAWFDPSYLEGDSRIRALIAKGREFSEADKASLREIELELLNAVLPAYRARQANGQIEISASPFYHPILPLLCDTEIYRHTHPHSRTPRRRFARPEDAFEQLERAAECHERIFGRRPVGLWPSEGSVSDQMLPLAARAGFEWMATDEMILARSLQASFRRDAHGHLDEAHRLYRPYRVAAGGAEISCAFRDHALSDLIGFVYASWHPEAAAEDFVNRLAEGGRRARSSGGGEDPTIFVILDGENAWEHFEGGGRPFLRALYARLSSHPELRTVTMGEACKGASQRLSGIFPGSWIDANFYIWIGHQDDQRAWSQLADARDALDRATGVDPDTLARAREEVLIAEGSDWCWWYGDDHSSEHDAEFDDLFRRHLRNVYRLLQLPVPDELFATNISAGATANAQVDPTGWITPRIDGESSSYFEWLGAGSIDARETAGAMHQIERRTPAIAKLSFGFDARHLYLRVDAASTRPRLLTEGQSLALLFLSPSHVRVVVSQGPGGLIIARSSRTAPGEPWMSDVSKGVAALGSILEIGVPLSELMIPSEHTLSFFVVLTDAHGAELERHPGGAPIVLSAFDPAFAARNWRA